MHSRLQAKVAIAVVNLLIVWVPLYAIAGEHPALKLGGPDWVFVGDLEEWETSTPYSVSREDYCSYSYVYTINWGDGTQPTVVEQDCHDSSPRVQHAYAKTGRYSIKTERQNYIKNSKDSQSLSNTFVEVRQLPDSCKSDADVCVRKVIGVVERYDGGDTNIYAAETLRACEREKILLRYGNTHPAAGELLHSGACTSDETMSPPSTPNQAHSGSISQKILEFCATVLHYLRDFFR